MALNIQTSITSSSNNWELSSQIIFSKYLSRILSLFLIQLVRTVPSTNLISILCGFNIAVARCIKSVVIFPFVINRIKITFPSKMPETNVESICDFGILL